MWKRLTGKFKGKTGKKGFTLVELLAVVAIIAILCALVTMAAYTIVQTLRFKQRNDYAKTIFMAAQTQLTQMHSDGTLESLQNGNPYAGASFTVETLGAADFPDDLSNQYVYTSSLDPNLIGSFSSVLPSNSIESVLRGNSIIIEYNPITGNVYSVFYSEDANILSLYRNGALPRDDTDARKDMMLGYYSGSALTVDVQNLAESTVQVEYSNGQEGVITVKVPVPSALQGNPNGFADALDLTLTFVGEMNGGKQVLKIMSADSPNDLAILDWESGSAVLKASYTLDSLCDASSFANLASGSGSSLAAISSESSFSILPGENITVKATASYTGDDVAVDIQPGIIAGVNPLFDYLIPSGSSGKYILSVSNGRNLQNLNVLAPSVAEKVKNVVFSEDIDWSETVAYYASYTNSTNEAPARALPYFVPIHNEKLFGTELASAAGKADVVGNGHTVKGLNIDVSALPTVSYYVTGGKSVTNSNFAGLFAFVGTNITGLNISNSTVKGLTVGGLVGQKTGGSIYDCNVSSTTINVVNASYAGGLVGINSGNIDSCTAGVTINYSPTTTAKAIIGGLVGQMSSGTLSNSNVSGKIKLGTTVAAANKQYIVGGAVGNDAGGASYSSLSSTVTVDTTLKGSNTGSTNVTDPSKVGNGSVGMFVGLVADGKFSDCATTATNNTYQFLGQIKHDPETLTGDGWYSHATKTGNETISMGSDDLDTVAAANGYTKLSSGYSFPTSYEATLSNCTFLCGTATYLQELDLGESYFTATTEGDSAGGYLITKCANGWTAVHPRYSHLMSDNDTDGIVETDYYYKNANGTYSRVYIESVRNSQNNHDVTLYKDGEAFHEFINLISLGTTIKDQNGDPMLLYINGFDSGMSYIITDVDYTVALLPDTITTTAAQKISSFSLTDVFGSNFAETLSESGSYSYIGSADGFSDCFWTLESLTSGIRWRSSQTGTYKYLRVNYKYLLGNAATYYTTVTASGNGYIIKYYNTTKYLQYTAAGGFVGNVSTSSVVGILAVTDNTATSLTATFNCEKRAADCIATKIS